MSIFWSALGALITGIVMIVLLALLAWWIEPSPTGRCPKCGKNIYEPYCDHFDKEHEGGL